MLAQALDIDNLCVDYGPKRALDKISLQVAPGEVLGVVGPNGSGKSTLVRSITGKLCPSSGTIRVQGKPLLPAQAHHHAVAFAPQSLGLYQHLTARENLEVFGSFAGLGRKQSQEQALRALADTQLSEKANTLTRHLSGGMQRRLHIAATFLASPELLVLDEPTAGVDLAARADIHTLIQNRAAQGAAVVLVTHELGEAEKLCHKIGVLHRGQLLGLAPPHQLVVDVFGNAHLFCVRTAQEPPPDVKEVFHRLGLAPSANSREWHMKAERPLKSFVAQISDELDACGSAIDDLSMRRPNLNDVMRHLAGAQPPCSAAPTARGVPQDSDKEQRFD